VVLGDMPVPEAIDLVVGDHRPADVATVLVNAADPGGACTSLLLGLT